jgi:hypothetical protein
VLSALLKKFYWKTLTKQAYKEIKQSSFGRERDNYSSRNSYSDMDSSEIRLFIARWRKDSFMPWSLIQFIEKEVWMNIGQVWKINILDNFSYMNVEREKWEIILDYFKRENKVRPLIVKAKEKKWWRWFSGRWWYRKWWNFKSPTFGWRWFKKNNTWFKWR